MKRIALAPLVLLLALPPPAQGDAETGRRKSATCVQCHGPDGNSAPPFPRLAGQYPDYLVQALKAYKNGERKNPIMAPFAQALSERDMWDLAEYFSSRPNGLTIRPRVSLSPAEQRSELPAPSSR